MRVTGTLGDTIARAIKRNDTSYFFENYSRQADAVLKAMDEAGYVLIRKKPSPKMIEAAVETMTLGIHNKGELAEEIYARMVAVDLRRPR